MTFTDLFSDRAQSYAAARPRYPSALFSSIVKLAPSATCAWDCGTGNGQAAVSLAEHFGTVCATDPSAEQIANAVPASNVHYSVQTAESTSFSNQTFDAVCVAQALHWFKFADYFAEVKRVAKPGAIFCAWGYDWFRISQDFDRAFQESILDVVAPFWAPQNSLLWRGYADVHLPFERITLPTLQIEAHWNFYQVMAYVRTWSAVRRCEASNGVDFLLAAEQRLAPHWGPPEIERLVSMPLHTLAGRVS
jgi:ubiquinone/menaquinone biosynthesis C-methylase UbiE